MNQTALQQPPMSNVNNTNNSQLMGAYIKLEYLKYEKKKIEDNILALELEKKNTISTLNDLIKEKEIFTKMKEETASGELITLNKKFGLKLNTLILIKNVMNFKKVCMWTYKHIMGELRK